MGELTLAEATRKGERHPWRENLEALLMAIVVALLFKYFVLEISKIPSGSMQPTLMGNPESGVFDRVLVDKLSYHFRDPLRFEVVVFKHPLEQSRIMVKRLIGIGPEELRVYAGDLWTRPDATSPWSILRRPASVQEEMWRRLDLGRAERSAWKVASGEGWAVDGHDVIARGDGRILFRGGDKIRDSYLDGYPVALEGEITAENPSFGRNPVGDLRVEGRVRALAGTRAISIELRESARVYRFDVPGPAADPQARAEIVVLADPTREGDGISDEVRSVRSVAATRLEAGDALRFAAMNLDDRLVLVLGGEEVASLEIESIERPEATLAIGLEGEGASFEDLAVSRDVYYLPGSGPSWEVRIPAGHYVMLGDNTQDSADSRAWQAVRFAPVGRELREGIAGNFRRGGENPSEGRSADGRPLRRFRDRFGEHHWFSADAYHQDFPVPAPLVPRKLLQGRAVSIFWPIRPLDGLWRLGWLP